MRPLLGKTLSSSDDKEVTGYGTYAQRSAVAGTRDNISRRAERLSAAAGDAGFITGLPSPHSLPYSAKKNAFVASKLSTIATDNGLPLSADTTPLKPVEPKRYVGVAKTIVR